MKSKIESIQVLRGFAALIVVFRHVFMDIKNITPNSNLINFYKLEYFGSMGVDIFRNNILFTLFITCFFL